MLKPTIKPIKHNGTRAYKATLGEIEVIAPTPTEARAACEALALEALQYRGCVVLHDLHRGPESATWILERNVCGAWGYRIARPMRAGSHFDGHSSCMLNVASRYDAENAMRAHWYSINVAPFVDMLRALALWAMAVNDTAHRPLTIIDNTGRCNVASMMSMFGTEIARSIRARGALPEELADLATLTRVEVSGDVRWRIDPA